MTGFKIFTTLERTIYLDLPENASEEEVENALKKYTTQPIDALKMAYMALRKMGIQTHQLDLNDWSMLKIQYEKI